MLYSCLSTQKQQSITNSTVVLPSISLINYPIQRFTRIGYFRLTLQCNSPLPSLVLMEFYQNRSINLQMGCQNSNSVQPMPHEVLHDNHNPKPKHKPVVPATQNVTVTPAKENESPPRKTSIKIETHPLPSIKTALKPFEDCTKRRSKSECYALQISASEVIAPQPAPDDKKMKKPYLLPKLKSESKKKDTKEPEPVGPSSHSIELPASKAVLTNEKMVFDKKQAQNEVHRHFQGQPPNETKTQSLASEKIQIQPVKFQVDKSLKADSQRSLIYEEKEEVGYFMDNLINYQNEQVLQQVVNRLEEKESKQAEFKEPESSPYNTQKIMQQQIIEEQKRMQKEILASIEVQASEPALSNNNLRNTEQMVQEQILKEEDRIDRQVINSIVQDTPQPQTEAPPSQSASSINTEKMMKQQILEDQQRMQREVLLALETGSTPLLAE